MFRKGDIVSASGRQGRVRRTVQFPTSAKVSVLFDDGWILHFAEDQLTLVEKAGNKPENKQMELGF